MAETTQAAPWQSLYVRANGVKTHFIVAGAGEPIVLVHGGGPGASGEYGWRRNIPALADHFQVFALDRIGFGLTDKPAITLADQLLADHLADFMINRGQACFAQIISPSCRKRTRLETP